MESVLLGPTAAENVVDDEVDVVADMAFPLVVVTFQLYVTAPVCPEVEHVADTLVTAVPAVDRDPLREDGLADEVKLYLIAPAS